MFVFSAVLEATQENVQFPPGEKHAALLYVLADDRAQAINRIPDGIKAKGWICADLEKSGEMDESHLKPELDQILVDTFRIAQKNGFAIIIYTEPIL